MIRGFDNLEQLGGVSIRQHELVAFGPACRAGVLLVKPYTNVRADKFAQTVASVKNFFSAPAALAFA